MAPPPTHATADRGNTDEEVPEAEPKEAPPSTATGDDAEPQDGTGARLSPCTSISGLEGESAIIVGSTGSSPTAGDYKREGDFDGSSLGVANGGVLRLDLPVRQHSQGSEGNSIPIRLAHNCTNYCMYS